MRTLLLLICLPVLAWCQNTADLVYIQRGEHKTGQCVICGVDLSWWEEDDTPNYLLLGGSTVDCAWNSAGGYGQPVTYEGNIFCGPCAKVYLPWLRNIVTKYINGWQADSIKARERYDNARKLAAEAAIKRKIEDAEDELSFLKTGKRPHAERREKENTYSGTLWVTAATDSLMLVDTAYSIRSSGWVVISDSTSGLTPEEIKKLKELVKEKK